MQSDDNGKGGVLGLCVAQWASESWYPALGLVQSAVRFVIIRGRVRAKTVR